MSTKFAWRDRPLLVGLLADVRVVAGASTARRRWRVRIVTVGHKRESAAPVVAGLCEHWGGEARVDDVVPNGHAVERASVRQRKTGRPVRFELTEQTRQAINDYLTAARKKPGDYLFSGRRLGQRMTTRQYARLLSDWLVGIGLDPHVYGTHSLRRTKATLIYRVARAIYGPCSSFSVTRRLRARCDIWASTSMMLLRYPNRSTSDRAGHRAERRLCRSALMSAFLDAFGGLADAASIGRNRHS